VPKFALNRTPGETTRRAGTAYAPPCTAIVIVSVEVASMRVAQVDMPLPSPVTPGFVRRRVMMAGHHDFLMGQASSNPCTGATLRNFTR